MEKADKAGVVQESSRITGGGVVDVDIGLRDVKDLLAWVVELQLYFVEMGPERTRYCLPLVVASIDYDT